MPDPISNPLTRIFDRAALEVEKLEARLLQEYGIPLYVKQETKGGRGAWAFPADPDQMSPEEMAVLLEKHGEETVNNWLMDHYTRKAELEEAGLDEAAEGEDE